MQKIKILYEDKDILAIDKPSGIAVHSDGKTKEKTITDWVLKHYPKLKNVGEPMGEIVRPGIVHRLDKETSGVLLLAKNSKAHEFLKNQFVNREVEKTYIAIVDGFVNLPTGSNRGVVNKPIGRSPRDFRRYSAGRGARGEMREAITFYKVLRKLEIPACEKFSSSSHPRPIGRSRSHTMKISRMRGLKKFSLLEIHPKTGRTHQIRVHMKYLNHPVACDSLYNSKGHCPDGLKRLALHAESIEFKNLKGETVKVKSPLPKEFVKLVKSA